MKIFMKVLVCVIVISILFSNMMFESTCRMLEDDVLRLHIRANSDSTQDQNLKITVRNAVLEKVSPLYENVKTKEEAEKITVDNLDYIKQIAEATIKSEGFDYKANVAVTEEFFDTRYYDDFTMPAGVYKTLLITIGKGKGNNWWCVMYPTLCVGASSRECMKSDLSEDEYDVVTSGEYHFRFKTVEIFKKICNFFG